MAMAASNSLKVYPTSYYVSEKAFPHDRNEFLPRNCPPTRPRALLGRVSPPQQDSKSAP